MTEYTAIVEPRPEFVARLEPGTVIPAPQPGWSLELQRTPTHLQVREVRDGEVKPWLDVVALAELAGPAGAVPVFAVVDGALAYRFGDSGPWGQLLTIESLKGNDGLSAYQLWKEAGNVGTVVEFLESLKGRDSTVPGPDGWSVEVQKTSTHIQTRRVRGAEATDWADLVLLADLKGSDGTSATPAQISTVVNAYLTANPPSGDTWHKVGSGMPNGVVTAPIGTTYTDTSRTNGARKWFKESGTGSTGWVVELGDTDWRYLDASHFPNHTNSEGAIRRINERVYFVATIGTVVYNAIVYTLTEGFQGNNGFNINGSARLSGLGSLISDIAPGNSQIPMNFDGGSIRFHGRAVNGVQRVSMSWLARPTSPWATGTLPGIKPVGLT